jgi:hypothetical protein
MTSDTVIHAVALCIVLAGAETLHGIARTVLVVPRLGKERALKLSALSGSVLAFVICFFLVPGVGLRSFGAHLLLGVVIALFMAGFDIAIGRWLLRKAWRKIWPDFNPATGNYLSFGLLFLVFAPVLVAWLRPVS